MGTTSFRTKEFNLMIEMQLQLLHDFWEQHPSERWSNNEDIQTSYYNFLLEQKFVTTEANRKAKDARQKTSGLVDLGLIDSERRLTEVGNAFLNIDYRYYKESNNIMQIPEDSFLYMKQLLKTYNSDIAGKIVRPYVVLIMALLELDYLSLDEFTFLLPLICDQQSYNKIISEIKDYRSGKIDIDTVIVNSLMSMKNYKEALDILMKSPNVNSDLLCEVGMNRKSRDYDKPYFPLYEALKQMVFSPSVKAILAFDNISRKVRIGSLWRNYLYNNSSEGKIKKKGLAILNNRPVFKCANEQDFRKEFFCLMHLFKAKATLSDYYDLNKRYFSISDTVIFRDDTVQLDILPKCYFGLCPNLSNIAFTASNELKQDIALDKILSQTSAISQEEVIASLTKDYGIPVDNVDDVKKYVEDERLGRFNDLIDSKFSDEKLIELFSLFEDRKDDEIQKYITDNADAPTLFEFVSAIAWYKISERRGNILDYMNLSLDANLLPKTHAGGGEEDITYKYSASSDYPAHTLLIELTLAESTNQRRMEGEPVTRHLGDYLLHHGNNAYALFVSTFLHINTLSYFRGSSKSIYYDSADTGRYIEGMNIATLETADLKTILENGIKYPQLYKIFNEAFKKELHPKEWFEGIKQDISRLTNPS